MVSRFFIAKFYFITNSYCCARPYNDSSLEALVNDEPLFVQAYYLNAVQYYLSLLVKVKRLVLSVFIRRSFVP